MIVVDANIVVYAIVRSAHTPLAEDVAARDPDWVAPPLWRYEFTSAVATLVRSGGLTASQAEAAIGEADRLMSGRERAVDQVAALHAAAAHDLSAYDAQYVALAQDEGVRCVTADARMQRNAPGVAVSPQAFIAGPTAP